jgi:hypothetical protein
MEYAINKNTNFNSLEITFAGKPDEQTRNALKANGYRWHGVRRIWYGYTDEQTIRAALDGVTIENANEQTTSAKTPERTAKNRLPSLWERCDVSGIKQHDKNNLPPVKDIAALLRKELKTRFPEVKFSITSTYNTIDAYIKASPYERRHIMKDRRTGEPDKYGYFEDSDELNAVQAYCKALADSWNYDDSDTMTDYFDVHFYGGYFQISGNYEQTEPTDEQKADIADFKKRKAEKEERDHAEFLAQCERDRIQREKDEAAARIQAQKDAIAREQIEKAAIVTDIPENERRVYFDLAEYCKISSLDDGEKWLEEYIKDGEQLPQVDAVVSRRVDFNGYSDNDKKIFANFCRMFMFGFTFLQGKGGHETADARVTKENYEKLTSEQRKGVKWYDCDCVAVYNNGVLQFIIDPEGFSYARYILQLPEGFDERIDSENAAEWINAQKEETSKRTPFYIPAPVGEQIAQACLQPGERVTVLTVDGWVMVAQEYRGTLESIEAKAWAQYSDAGKITITRAGKRKPDELHFHRGETFALYRGILPEVPNSLKYEESSGGLQLVNYAGAGADGYIKSVMKYYKTLGYTPVIDLIAK